MWLCVAGVGRCTRRCACEALPSRVRQVSACSLTCLILSACVSENVSTTCLSLSWSLSTCVSLGLSRRLYVFISESLDVSLSSAAVLHSAPSRVNRVRLGDLRPRPGGAQLLSPRWGLRQRGASRAGTGVLSLQLQSRKTGSLTPLPGAERGWGR